MFHYIRENLSTIVVGIVVFGFVAFVAVRMQINKRRGKSACASCTSCPMSDQCRGK